MLQNLAVRWALASAALCIAAPSFAMDETIETEKAKVRVETFADGLSHPWGLAFLPDRTLLVTERDGRLRHVSEKGEVSEPIEGVPDVDARGQGGLLDVAVDPSFSKNRRVYVSFSEPGDGGNSTAVAVGRLSEDAKTLVDVDVIFSQRPKLPSKAHFGSRLVFDGKGHLFVTLGERFAETTRIQAQHLDSHLGKIVRIGLDGSVPKDNPFVGKAGALPEIWSLGHRNPQAAAMNPATGELWEIEHGPMGGDEINIVEAGKNFGWPEVSFGLNYDGTPVGTGKSQAPGFEPPIYQWTPVIAPSGMTFYGGKAFPSWQGNLFVGGLKVTSLVRLELDGRKVAHEERILTKAGKRIRDVVEGPDGALFLLTDADNGEILRLSPAEGSATE